MVDTGSKPSSPGLRERLTRRLLGGWAEAQERQTLELLELKAALARAGESAAEERSRIRAHFEARLEEQAQQAEQRRTAAERRLTAIESGLGEAARGQRESHAQLAALLTSTAAGLQSQMDEYGRLLREYSASWSATEAQLTASFQAGLREQTEQIGAQQARIAAGFQGQLDEYGRLLREQATHWSAAQGQLSASLQLQLDEYGSALRKAGESWERFQAGLDASVSQRLAEVDAGRRDFASARREVAEALERHEALAAGLSRLRLEWDAARKYREDALAEGLRRFGEGFVRLEARLDGLRDNVGEGFDYTAFEDRFRGAEEDIRARQSIYIPMLKGREPVLDLGCGRGELLRLLAEAGVPARGVDFNASQAARCTKDGLEVVHADFLRWLPAQAGESQGAVVALQVVEHLTMPDLRRLIDECRRVLKPDGLLLFETVNPHCPEALEWFYIDPTHQRPVYPEMLEFLLGQAGFSDVRIRFQVPCTGAPKNRELTAKTGADFAIWGYKR